MNKVDSLLEEMRLSAPCWTCAQITSINLQLFPKVIKF